ncbi:hypothetical protein M8818_004124 [Zalaria obscura]|uniref:Uncharacterized protein n=1 Tax=Zalaria obscura TaxID=2024903 RepID=A0ACC3SCB3_9PEZI
MISSIALLILGAVAAQGAVVEKRAPNYCYTDPMIGGIVASVDARPRPSSNVQSFCSSFIATTTTTTLHPVITTMFNETATATETVHTAVVINSTQTAIVTPPPTRRWFDILKRQVAAAPVSTPAVLTPYNTPYIRATYRPVCGRTLVNYANATDSGFNSTTTTVGSYTACLNACDAIPICRAFSFYLTGFVTGLSGGNTTDNCFLLEQTFFDKQALTNGLVDNGVNSGVYGG